MQPLLWRPLVSAHSRLPGHHLSRVPGSGCPAPAQGHSDQLWGGRSRHVQLPAWSRSPRSQGRYLQAQWGVDPRPSHGDRGSHVSAHPVLKGQGADQRVRIMPRSKEAGSKGTQSRQSAISAQHFISLSSSALSTKQHTCHVCLTLQCTSFSFSYKFLKLYSWLNEWNTWSLYVMSCCLFDSRC